MCSNLGTHHEERVITAYKTAKELTVIQMLGSNTQLGQCLTQHEEKSDIWQPRRHLYVNEFQTGFFFLLILLSYLVKNMFLRK